MSEIYHVTKEDMLREPVDAWRVDRLHAEIRRLRQEIIRLKLKAGETITLEDVGFGVGASAKSVHSDD